MGGVFNAGAVANPGKLFKEAGNFVGDISGANRAADAAQNAANAQAAMARQTRQDILDQARRNEQLAQATPQELSALSRAYASADKSLAREEQLIGAIDPALMEASQQALRLLRGETADINKPMTDLRASQRQSLLNSLRSQYGPGAESTSVGQKALNQFDMETNALFANNQSNALNQAFGIASTDFGGRLTRGIGQVQGVGEGYGAIQNRRLNAGNATLAALSGTSQQMIQAAGAPYVGEALRAQGQQSVFNQGVGLASVYAGNYASGAGFASGINSAKPPGTP